MKKGEIYFKAWINLETLIGEKASIELEEYHVNHINKNGIYLVQKEVGASWGKRSKTQGDFGFFKSIPEFYKKRVSLDSTPKSLRMHKTKEQAYKSAIPELKKYVKDSTRLLKLAEKKAIKK